MAWVQTLDNLVADDEGQLSWKKIKTTGENVFIGLRKIAPYGFFTPFQSKTDLALTLAAPVVILIAAPFALSVLATISAIAAAAAAITCLSSLFVAGVAAAFEKKDIQNTALKIAAVSGILTAGCVVLASLASLGTTLASLVALSYLATRTGASLVEKADLCNNKNQYRIYDPEEPGSFTPG